MVDFQVADTLEFYSVILRFGTSKQGDSDVGDDFEMLVTSLNVGAKWPKLYPRPFGCHQHISSITSITKIFTA